MSVMIEAPAIPSVGDQVRPLERTITTTEITAYGAATWDWHRIHHDFQFARAQDLPDVVLDGQWFGALFAKAAIDWLGPRSFVRKLAFRMRSMVFPGDSVHCEGEVVAVEPQGQVSIVTIAQRLIVGDRLAADAQTEVRLSR